MVDFGVKGNIAFPIHFTSVGREPSFSTEIAKKERNIALNRMELKNIT